MPDQVVCDRSLCESPRVPPYVRCEVEGVVADLGVETEPRSRHTHAARQARWPSRAGRGQGSAQKTWTNISADAQTVRGCKALCDQPANGSQSAECPPTTLILTLRLQGGVSVRGKLARSQVDPDVGDQRAGRGGASSDFRAPGGDIDRARVRALACEAARCACLGSGDIHRGAVQDRGTQGHPRRSDPSAPRHEDVGGAGRGEDGHVAP